MDWVEEIKNCGSIRATARKHDVPYSTLCGWIKSGKGLPDSPVKARENDTPGSIIPEGYRARGTSTLYDEFGNVKLSWVKTREDTAQQEAMLQAMREAFCDVIPREELSPPPMTQLSPDYMNMYVLTDAHIGMAAWGEETRAANWDMKIAEEAIISWFRKAIELSPASETCVFAELGDFIHYTSLTAVTPTSGNIVDTDGRFQKMIRVAIRVMRRVIAMLLTKHQHVKVMPVAGNHNDAAAGIFKEAFPVFYENEPRVTFDSSPSVYHCHTFGKTALFFTHGHKAKHGAADRVMASLFKKEYGAAEFCYLHSGHLHHRQVTESPLMEMEIHPTLAAPDAYAALSGYISKRSSHCITYHREYGEVSRIRIPVEMLGVSS